MSTMTNPDAPSALDLRRRRYEAAVRRSLAGTGMLALLLAVAVLVRGESGYTGGLAIGAVVGAVGFGVAWSRRRTVPDERDEQITMAGMTTGLGIAMIASLVWIVVDVATGGGGRTPSFVAVGLVASMAIGMLVAHRRG